MTILLLRFFTACNMISKLRKIIAAFDAVMKDERQSLKSLTKQA
jgi:hypothetical protein